MAHLQQTAKSFADNFTSTFLQSSRLAQEESQFAREQDFKNRQLRLGEAFRRDELDETIFRNQTLSDYYDNLNERGIATEDLNIQKAKNELMFNNIFPVNENTRDDARTFPAFGDTYEVPVEPIKPEKRSTFGPIGSSGKFFGETQFEDGNVVGFDNVRPDPSISNRSNRPADISNEVGEVNKLLEIYKGFESDDSTIEVNLPNGEVAKWDKTLWRANAKRYTTDILQKVGINPQGDYLKSIRDDAGVVIYGENQWKSFSNQQKSDIATRRETVLLEEINTRRAQGEITEDQYQALRYWALVGSR